jgi:hypothetical protein
MTETAQLGHAGTGELLGETVAILGKTVVVGAPTSNQSGGAAYVYIEPQGGWVSTNSPTATLTEAGSKSLGNSVAIGMDLTTGTEMIAAGDASVTYGHLNEVQGDVIAYLAPKDAWQNSSDGIVLRPKGGQRNFVAAVGKNRVVVGAPQTTVGKNESQGEAFVYTIPAN